MVLIIPNIGQMVENGMLSYTFVEVEIGRTFLEGHLLVTFSCV